MAHPVDCLCNNIDVILNSYSGGNSDALANMIVQNKCNSDGPNRLNVTEQIKRWLAIKSDYNYYQKSMNAVHKAAYLIA
jgi:hypothetical protein